MAEQEADMMQEAREALAAMKENRRKQSPTEIAQKMYRMNFEGNIVPHSWYIHIKRENGKPYPVAVTLLSEIVYWYRPEKIKDEATGQVIGLRKRYAADKLQRTYESFANEFGFTKRQVKGALKHLEDMGIIDLDLRDIPVGDNVAGNVLFIGLDPDRLAEITYRIPSDTKVIDPQPSDGNMSEVYQNGVIGLPENGQTNTETSQETTPEITEEKTSFSAEKSVSDFPEKPPAPPPGGDAGVADDAAIVEEIIAQTETHPDQFTLGRVTEIEREKAGGNWAVPPSAGGADAFRGGPVDAFCEVLAGIPPLKLPPELRKSWGDKLREIAAKCDASSEVMERAIRAIPEDQIGWKTFSGPYADNFEDNIIPLLLRDGKPRQKGANHGAHQRDRGRIAQGAVRREVATEEEARAILG